MDRWGSRDRTGRDRWEYERYERGYPYRDRDDRDITNLRPYHGYASDRGFDYDRSYARDRGYDARYDRGYDREYDRPSEATRYGDVHPNRRYDRGRDASDRLREGWDRMFDRDRGYESDRSRFEHDRDRYGRTYGRGYDRDHDRDYDRDRYARDRYMRGGYEREDRDRADRERGEDYWDNYPWSSFRR